MTASAKKLLSYLLKAAILILAFVYIYRRINNNTNLKQFEQLIAGISRTQVIVTMSVVFLLMLVNWLLESFKWKYLTRELVKISAWKAIEAVFCGLTWAIFTPNRIGEYGGRVMFLPPAKRIQGVFVMAVGSFGQNVITNFLGLTALIWFNYTYFHLNTWAALGLSLLGICFMILLLLVYFNIGWLVTLLNKIKFLK
ncbi:MAG TPA: hypothetical protein VFE54_12585, partial [Mucilaginibacter sp.]|nr:hypothetical protein [Mucilaginibacter sp.]